mgnify:CR=1 FL=1
MAIMKIIYRSLITFLFIFLFSYPVLANKIHGIAMHGLPIHGQEEKYLPYVNPDAPKGGMLRLGVYGSFDNLNRIAFKGSKAAGLGYVNDTLMRRVWDEAFTLYGLIAKYAEMPEDRSYITFYINSRIPKTMKPRTNHTFVIIIMIFIIRVFIRITYFSRKTLITRYT